MNRNEKPTIAILGGTGPEGRGLALRWAAAGYRVIIGSRDADRARDVAAALTDRLEDAGGAVAPDGDINLAAARAADVVVLAVPYAAQDATLASVGPALDDKVLITAVVPLKPPRVATVRLPTAGSAAAEAQVGLGERVRVVAAFQNVSATKLEDLAADLGCDVFVCGDESDAKALTLTLVRAAGATGFDAGPLANAGVVEGLTSILIGINRRHGVRGAGVRLTNIPREGREGS